MLKILHAKLLHIAAAAPEMLRYAACDAMHGVYYSSDSFPCHPTSGSKFPSTAFLNAQSQETQIASGPGAGRPVLRQRDPGGQRTEDQGGHPHPPRRSR